MKAENLILATTILLQILISNSISAFPTNFLPFPNTTADHLHDFDPSQIPNFTSPVWNSFQNLSGCHLGDQLEGLAKLKQYFSRFGYIATDPNSSFTDHFDDSLESALKTYQHNFNLNATGILDDTTLTQIARPRCGNADIINGSSSMNSGKASSSSASKHLHSVAHYSFFPGTPRWSPRNRELTYAFLPANRLTDSVKAVFSRAFARWSEVTPLKFREISSYYAADITIGFFSGDHGDGESFDGALRTLAHAFSPPNGRFHLDADESWVTDGGDASTSSLTGYTDAVDLESVAVHEIGHLLGLGHSSVEDSIMYPTITSGRKKVDLAGDDVEGIQILYGSNPNYNGTTTSTTQSSQDRDSGFFSGVHSMRINTLELGIFMVFAVLLLL